MRDLFQAFGKRVLDEKTPDYTPDAGLGRHQRKNFKLAKSRTFSVFSKKSISRRT